MLKVRETGKDKSINFYLSIFILTKTTKKCEE